MCRVGEVNLPNSNCTKLVVYEIANDGYNTSGNEADTSTPNCELFYFILWGIIGSCFCLLGMVGNALSFSSFHKDRRSPAVVLLQCLACSDFVLLFAVFVTDDIPYACTLSPTCSNVWHTWPYIRYIWILTPMAHMCSIWFVVLIAGNRFFAVCKPHNMARLWSLQRTAVYVLTVVITVLLFNVPRFFEYRMVEKFDNDTNSTNVAEERTWLGVSHSYKTVYKVYLVNVLLVLLPLLTLISLTIPILWALHLRRRNERNKQKTSTLSKASQEITLVLSLVLVVAIVCQTPIALFHFIRNNYKYVCGDYVFYVENISKLLVTINSCINFVIYCLFSPRFRRLLWITVMCKGRAYLAQIEPYASSRREYTMSYLRG